MPASSSSRRDRVALYLLVAGGLLVVLVALPYKRFDLDRYFVPKELVLHACAWLTALLCISKRRQLTLTLVDVLLAGFLVVSAVSSVFAPNVWVAERAFAISLSGAALFWVTSTLRRAGLVRPLVAWLAFAVVVGAATSLAQAYGVDSDYFSLNRAPGGTFGNRNFVAHLCAIGLPVLILVALTARRGVNSLLSGIGVGVVSAALVLSRSRGAWLAILALAVPVGILAIMTWSKWCEARTLRRLFVIGIAAVAGAAAAILLPNTLNWRSDSPYLESATGLVNYKEGSGRGRLVQYTNSLHITEAHPLLGVGPGNWPVVYPKYASRNDPSLSPSDGMTSNPWPSSDWVAYLSERGVIGLALLLLVFLGLFGRAVRELWQTRSRADGGSPRDPERVMTALALVGTLVATAVVGTFDAVLLLALPTFFVWTLAGALAPPVTGRASFRWGVHDLAPALVFGLGVIVVGRSACQLAAIAISSTSSRAAALETASLLDPGNYRIQMRAAETQLNRGRCDAVRSHARKARDLFPNAAEPRHYLSACGR